MDGALEARHACVRRCAVAGGELKGLGSAEHGGMLHDDERGGMYDM